MLTMFNRQNALHQTMRQKFCFSFALFLKGLTHLCHVPVLLISVLMLFLTVPLVGLQYVIVAFPGHTHLFFSIINRCTCTWLF